MATRFDVEEAIRDALDVVYDSQRDNDVVPLTPKDKERLDRIQDHLEMALYEAVRLSL